MKIAGFTTKNVFFDSQGLNLEGLLYSMSGPGRSPAVIVCHPHPQYGGSMDNNVVDAICQSLAASGIIALKFNFRGVGASQGTFDNGRGEQADIKAALEFILNLPEVDIGRLGLAGYSAGAAWGLAAVSSNPAIKALAAISPPLDLFDFSFIQNLQKPVLLISGSLDDLVSPIHLKQLCSSLPRFLICLSVAGADHSWFGFEPLVTAPVTQFFTTKLSAGAAEPESIRL